MITFAVGQYTFSLQENCIEAICLFGSVARGDQDEKSDIDLLFIVDDKSGEDLLQFKRQLIARLGVPDDWISLYNQSMIDKMASNGSYFLWHIKLEAKIVYSKTGFLERVLRDLRQHVNAADHLHEYLQICDDIRRSINRDEWTTSYELNVLASLIRNTCITWCYSVGVKMFSRVGPVKNRLDVLGVEAPFSIEEYNKLYKYRLAYSRSQTGSLPTPSKQEVIKWVERASYLICKALKEGD